MLLAHRVARHCRPGAAGRPFARRWASLTPVVLDFECTTEVEPPAGRATGVRQRVLSGFGGEGGVHMQSHKGHVGSHGVTWGHATGILGANKRVLLPAAREITEVGAVLATGASASQMGLEGLRDWAEMPVGPLEPKTLAPLREFQAYVRPVHNPILSEHCRSVTGVEHPGRGWAGTHRLELVSFQAHISAVSKWL